MKIQLITSMLAGLLVLSAWARAAGADAVVARDGAMKELMAVLARFQEPPMSKEAESVWQYMRNHSRTMRKIL